MIACQRCGYQNHPTSKFCASCGGPMPAAQAAAQQGGAGHPQASPGAHAPPAQPGWGPQPGAMQPPQGPQGWGAPPQAPQPHPGWGQPPGTPGQPGFSPEYARVGTPQQGLNPFGATMAPDPNAVGPYGAPPPMGPGGHPGAPPPGVGPGGYGPPGYGYAPGSPDPAAFAATAPPPTADENRYAHPPAAHGAPPPGYGPPPAAPAQHPSAPQPSAPPPGYGQGGATQASAGHAHTEPDRSRQKAPRVLAGFLVSYESELGQAWQVYQGSNVIGRLDAAEGLDIEIDHPTTSSRHAVIQASARPGRMTLEDLGSTNGTYRGDAKLEPGVQVQLADGDAIRFGGFSVTIKIV